MAGLDAGTTAPAAEAPPELTEDLARLRDMVEQSDVDGARAFVKELEQRWPNSQKAQHRARVLAPPVARSLRGVKGRSPDKERAWLREHGKEYPGCWLAVLGDPLIAADPDAWVVLKKVRETSGAGSALLHLQSGPCP
jgi:hypothetical protein